MLTSTRRGTREDSAMNEEFASTSADQPANPFPADLGKKVESGVESLTDYLKENPWVGVLGGLVFGAVLVTIAKNPQPEPTNLEKLRSLLEETYARLPSKKDAKSAMNCLLDKLHLPV